jgi:hypothetical protein
MRRAIKPSQLQSPAARRIILESMSPISESFEALFSDEVLRDPAVQELIEADEPLVHIWGDGSVSVAMDAMPPLLAWLKKNPKPAPQALAQRSGFLKRAAAYLDKLPPAISGRRGHAAAFNAALKILSRFDLTPDEALGLMLERFNPRCEPPWSEAELREKVENADIYLREAR